MEFASEMIVKASIQGLRIAEVLRSIGETSYAVHRFDGCQPLGELSQLLEITLRGDVSGGDAQNELAAGGETLADPVRFFELRIVGRAGYRAAPEAFHLGLGGNVVDLPALRWLAKQPGPRVWVSDGAVTGSGDLPNDEITKACRELCMTAGIKQVRDATRAAAALAAQGGIHARGDHGGVIGDRGRTGP